MSEAAHRCRLCTSNDRDALIEQLTERFWDTQKGGMDPWPWAEAGDFWQANFRRFAAAAVDIMRG